MYLFPQPVITRTLLLVLLESLQLVAQTNAFYFGLEETRHSYLALFTDIHIHMHTHINYIYIDR